MTFAGVSRAALLAGILFAPVAGTAMAQETGSDRDTVFILGRITNGIASSDGETVNASSISAEEMQKYDRASVDEALDLILGANASNTGGSRNEKHGRGHGRRRPFAERLHRLGPHRHAPGPVLAAGLRRHDGSR